MRDLTLGEPAFDFDLATTAIDQGGNSHARGQAGFKVALTGVPHGTVTLVVDGRPIETTTLAPGRRDRRPPGQGERSDATYAADARAARLHHQRAVAWTRRNESTITSADLMILPHGRVRFIGDPQPAHP